MPPAPFGNPPDPWRPAGEGSADGKGGAASFRFPSALATDGVSVFVCDTGNNTIRGIRIDTTEVVTLAGAPGQAGFRDGTGPEALFYEPNGIVLVGRALYITDTGNNVVRRLSLEDGAVTVTAGSPLEGGYRDGLGRAARFNGPTGLSTDGERLYVADTENHVIRQIEISTGRVTTLAGNPGERGGRNGKGRAASFNSPRGLYFNEGELFVADRWNHVIRVVIPATGEVRVFAGEVGRPGSDEGAGAEARFYQPFAVAGIGDTIFVADTYNHKIRSVIRN